jgi:hypothetical protein
MSNNLLFQRGLLADLDFSSAATITASGGTVTGALTYDSSRGAYFNGTTSYITYTNFQPFTSGFCSIVIEFYPDFEADEGVLRYFWYASNSKRFFHAVDNSLGFRFTSSTVSIPYADYAPYWKTGKRNVLVMSIYNLGVRVYLNGISLYPGSAPYAIETISSFQIGTLAGSNKFKGFINNIKMFQHQDSTQVFSQQEALDCYNNSTFTYQNRASFVLPMNLATYDPTNKLCRDTSSKGNHFYFGNKITTTTFPTKLSTCGYSFDGMDFLLTDNYVLPNGEDFTLTLGMIPFYSASTVYFYGIENTAGNLFPGFRLRYALGSGIQVVGSTYGYFTGVPWVPGVLGIYTFQYNATSKKWRGYYNGRFTVETTAAPPDGVYSRRHIIGGFSGRYVGSIVYASLYPFLMTSTQVINECNQALASMNKV